MHPSTIHQIDPAYASVIFISQQTEIAFACESACNNDPPLGAIGTPGPRVQDFRELNEYLRELCLQWAKSHRQPGFKPQGVWQVFEDEKSHLIPLPSHFDGYVESPARVSPSSLVSFDRNRYSVDCHHVGCTVQLRVYATRIIIILEG